MKTARLFVSCVAGMAMGAAQGQTPIPENDSFAARIALFSAAVSTTGSNLGATREAGEPDPSLQSEKSVWWTWRAPAHGSLTITTAGSNFDTMLSVFTGEAVSNLTLLAFNDTETNTSVVSLNVTAGTDYQVAVDGAGGAEGLIALQLSLGPSLPAPPNDDFANRQALTGSHLNNIAGSNLGATAELGEPLHADTLGLKSVWWTWMAPFSGGVTLTTKGSSIDTALGVYTGHSLDALVFVAANDEDPMSLLGLESRVTFNAISNVTYQIAVDGYEGDAGDLRLRLDLDEAFPVPANDHFANRKMLAGSNITTNSSNVGASLEAGEPLHMLTLGGKSVWYAWTAPASGGVTLSVSNDVLDTLVGVYRGSSLATLVFVAGNDEDFLTSIDGDSTTYFNVTAGTTYQIAVDGFDGTSGDFRLRLVLGAADPVPSNDNFANRRLLTGTNITATGFNYGATLEATEPLHCGYYGGKSVWWRWTAPAAGYVTIDTTGSSTDTLLAVYTGISLSTLAEVASDDESGGNYTSLVRFPTRSNVTYQIAVDGYDGDGFDLVLHVRLLPASFSLTITSNPAGAGTVSINPLPDPGGRYAPGSLVTLTAIPSGNAAFTGWSGQVVSTNNPLVLTMNSNKNVMANFFVTLPVIDTFVVLSNGAAELQGRGQSNLTYVLEATPTLNRPIPWAPIHTNTADAAGVYRFTNNNALAFPMRFFRTRRLP